MTSSAHPPRPVQVLKADTLRLVETAAPRLTQEHRAAMDRVWRTATQANSDLFDGPAVVCTGVEHDGRTLALSWAPVTYRWLALRRVPGAPAMSSVFVTVAQPTDDDALIVGRMSATTAAPGRWQFPGGNVEPPTAGRTLDEYELRRQACKELAEEIGLRVAPEDLALWAVTRGEHGNIGMHYQAPPLPVATLLQQFEALTESETANGRTPEFERITAVDHTDAERLAGPHADYLKPLLIRHDLRTAGGGE
ncbi:NUDIX domain-containing protein [Kitasatospora sp. SUK 42]|uniref:NUDIX domain-containing protein n=1 Tax=Kitasatospora sp. SUK 42 TaxID=1588882 RepID=UPI0018CA61A3|nr:NUDIX domain-containing protein [Kitasatospora sp. SUK 42]MBV2151440.1 NUDIX domain-containing protein [Kitasatospora sp. SUK 42]